MRLPLKQADETSERECSMAGNTDVLKEICSKRRRVNSEVLHQTISLAVEIAREGREGRKTARSWSSATRGRR